MKYYLLILIFLIPINNAFGEQSMQCDIGPIDKVYGKSKWFVNSCPDNITLVIYSYPESPASPFYFMFYKKEGKYNLYGEGTGDKNYTGAAREELSKLKENDIKAIILQTRSVKK